MNFTGFLKRNIQKKSWHSKVLILSFPLIFGLWSLLLGQDRNYDLANYHLYNAFAFLNNKLDLDFAVAELHSFSNPMLDIPYFLLIENLPPQFVAFFMGFFNGLIFIALFGISWEIIKPYRISNKKYIAFLLATSGILTPNFLAGLGNSMGDNVTALLVVISIYLLTLSFNTKEGRRYKTLNVLSGTLMGFATGLKLTNATFLIATFIAFLFLKKEKISLRIDRILFFSISSLIALLMIAGFWHFKLWVQFHNPVFPMFNHIFPTEYISKDAESIFGPKKIYEYFLWPFISAIDYHRAGRGLIHQIIWPLIYSLFIVLIYKYTFQKKKIDNKSLFILIFIAISYAINVKIFTVQRYLVAAEVLTSLSIFICFYHLFEQKKSLSYTKYSLGLSALIIFAGGFGTLGHSSYSNPPFNVELPRNIFEKNSIVLLTDALPNGISVAEGADGSPISWMVTQFPKDLSFFRVDVFPNTENLLYEKIIDKKIYVMFPAPYYWRVDNVKKWTNILKKIGLLNSDENCRYVDKIIHKIHFRGQIYTSNNSCEIILKKEDEVDIDALNIKKIEEVNQSMLRKKISIDKKNCKIYKANIGSQNWRYGWCENAILLKN